MVTKKEIFKSSVSSYFTDDNECQHNWQDEEDVLTGEKIKICRDCNSIMDSDGGIIN